MTPAETRTHAAVPRTHEAASSAAATPQPRGEQGGAPCLERVARKVRLVLIEGAEERGLGDTGAQLHAETQNHKPGPRCSATPCTRASCRTSARGHRHIAGGRELGAHPQLYALTGNIEHVSRFVSFVHCVN
jgi:hypothetical protein